MIVCVWKINSIKGEREKFVLNGLVSFGVAFFVFTARFLINKAPLHSSYALLLLPVLRKSILCSLPLLLLHRDLKVPWLHAFHLRLLRRAMAKWRLITSSRQIEYKQAVTILNFFSIFISSRSQLVNWFVVKTRGRVSWWSASHDDLNVRWLGVKLNQDALLLDLSFIVHFIPISFYFVHLREKEFFNPWKEREILHRLHSSSWRRRREVSLCYFSCFIFLPLILEKILNQISQKLCIKVEWVKRFCEIFSSLFKIKLCCCCCFASAFFLALDTFERVRSKILYLDAATLQDDDDDE